MKNLICGLILLMIPFISSAHISEEPEVYRLKFITEKQWDDSLGRWMFKSVHNYYYDDNSRLFEVLVRDKDGNNVKRSVYVYDNAGLRTELWFQNWNDTNWVSSSRYAWNYYDDGNIKDQIVLRYENGEWTDYVGQFDYEYGPDGQLLKDYYKVFREEGWQDYSYDIWEYDDDIRLLQRINYLVNGKNRFRDTIFYSNDYLRSQLIQQWWRNDTWENNQKRIYLYNDCNYLDAVIYQRWADDEWQNKTKQIRHYELNEVSQKKITICHKGMTKRVPVKALRAHLRHGDCIGPCSVERSKFKESAEDDKPGWNKPKYKSHDLFGSHGSFRIYPNPVKGESFKVEMDNDTYTKLQILDYSGRPIRSIDIRNRYAIEVSARGLNSGMYFLRFTGKQSKMEKIVVE